MSIDDFSKLIKSRSRRSLTRTTKDNNNEPYRKLIERIRKLKTKGAISKPIKTHIRDGVILPEWLGLQFQVHNGKEWTQFEITLEKLGKRLGDFSHTTKMVKHSGAGVGATRGSKFVPLK